MAGEDQTRAELRAPSFRGLMRYWQRALVGGVVGTKAEGLKTIIEQEMKVFGATDAGSVVTVRVGTSEPATIDDYYKEGTARWNSTGKDYLLWSMEQFGNRPRRRYFPQGTEFQIKLSTRGNDLGRFKQALAAFWLLVHLGGVGSRSRRCAGSVTIQSTENEISGLSFHEPATIEALQIHLQQGIDAVRRLYALVPTQVTKASFDVLARGHCRIWLLHNDGKAWDTPDKTMNAIGINLQAYRSGIQPLKKRKIFGLPLKGVSNVRWASPLRLRVAKLQGEQYVGIAVLFKTEGQDIFQEDYKLVEGWIKAFPGSLEVRL